MAGSPDGKSETLPRPFGKYVLRREAGRGGKGVIYDAVDSVLQRRVALKVLIQDAKADPEEMKSEEEKFLLEARLGAHLPKHPNIVSVYEGGVIDGRRYLATEFIDGEPMTQWRKGAGVTLSHQVRLLHDVALALDHVHRHKIVHRDIKPSNILVDKDGRPHITDFGLAKMLGQEADTARTSAGKVWGTPAYVSPEHARGLEVDARADVYPLGVMLYEALAGRPPFQGGTRSDVLSRVVNEPAVPPSKAVKEGTLTPRQLELEPVCLKALSKDPAGRHAGAKAFADDLGRWLDYGKTVRRKMKKSQAPLYGMIAAGVLLVAGLVLILATMKKGPSPEEVRARQEEQARQQERVEEEKQRAAAEAAAKAKQEAEEKAGEDKDRLRRDMEAQRLASEEVALQEQAKLEAQRREAEERARKAEEKLKQAPVAVPAPAPPAPAPPAVEAPAPPPGKPKETPAPKAEAEKPAPKPAPPPPAPSGPAVTEAEKEIRKVFKDEYLKKTAGERAALAQKLFKAGEEAKDDPAMRFAALREARDLAAAAGDLDAALKAVDAMARSFVVDAAGMKAAAFQTAVRALEPDKMERAFVTGMDLLDRFARDSAFDEALKAAIPLEDLARKLRNLEYVKIVQARARDLRNQKAEWGRVRAFAEKLKQNPDDSEACLALGKFHASAGNWETALRLLIKGGNPELKDAAGKDLAGPKEAPARADAGDLWWALAEKEKALAFKAALQERAMNLYMDSLEGLPELRKAQIEKRLQAAVTSARTPLDKLRLMGLVFWAAPGGDVSGRNRDLVSGAAPSYSGTVQPVMDSGLKVLKFDGSLASYPASDAIRAFRNAGTCLAWIKPDRAVDTIGGMVFRGVPTDSENGGHADFSLSLYLGKVFLAFNGSDNQNPGDEGKLLFWAKHPLPGGRWGMCGATWGGGMVSLYVNGERDNVYKASPSAVRREEPGVVAIGCEPTGDYKYYAGHMAAAMLFNRALTDSEVRQVCQIVGIQVK